MKKMLAIIVSVLLLMTPVAAETNNVKEEWSSLVTNQIVEVEFSYEVSEDDMTLSDGLEFVGYENGKYLFKATKDLENAYVSLWAKKESGSSETEHESGNSNDHGKPGTEGSGEPKWDTLDLGKNSWRVDDDLGEYLYAIRIKVNDYQKHDHIIVKDVSENLTEPQGLEVRKLRPKEGGGVDTLPGEAEYEVLETNESGTFEIKIKVDKLEDEEYMMYDIVYYMSKLDPTKPRDNEYKVYTVEEWETIISGGEGSGEVKPEEPSTETPETPEEPEIPEEPSTEVPEVPENPDKPSEPEVPETPESEVPEAPTTPEEPNNPEKPNNKPTITENVVEAHSDDNSVSTAAELPLTGVGLSNLVKAGVLFVTFGLCLLVLNGKQKEE